MKNNYKNKKKNKKTKKTKKTTTTRLVFKTKSLFNMDPAFATKREIFQQILQISNDSEFFHKNVQPRAKESKLILLSYGPLNSSYGPSLAFVLGKIGDINNTHLAHLRG